jgi:hypothetical protein
MTDWYLDFPRRCEVASMCNMLAFRAIEGGPEHDRREALSMDSSEAPDEVPMVDST